MTAQALRVGLLTETAVQANQLRHLVHSRGHAVATALLSGDLNSAQLQSAAVDVWLVVVDFERGHYPQLEDWLEQLNLPVIVDDGQQSTPDAPDYLAWCRRMSDKLQRLRGAINLEQHPQGAARQVWVLAASTGGPEAVREFFQALPAGLDVGFVYVQHINTGYEKSLADIVNRHGQYPACPALDGDVLPLRGTVIVAGQQRVEFFENGTLLVKPEPWPGDYSPSVDQVFANLARCYGARCGAIVFSGMGRDGAAGVRMIHQQGGRVWAQSPATCAVASMPEAAIATRAVSLVATPTELARQLAERAAGARHQPAC